MRPANAAANSKWARLTWPAITVAVTGLFVALMVPIGLHSDDVGILQHASWLSYEELWTAPFMELFYRPVVVSLAKLGLDLGSGLVFLRVVQALLIVGLAVTSRRLLAPWAGPFGQATGVLILIASPLTLITVTPFAVGVSDTLVLLAFLLSVSLMAPEFSPQDKPRRGARISVVLAVLTALALLSKESGVLVALLSLAACLSRRRWGGAAAQGGLLVGYLVLRSLLVSTQPFAFESGLWFQMLTPGELSARFSESPYGYYAYNVASNFASGLLYLPVKGQLQVTVAGGLMAITCAISSALVLRYVIRRHGVRGLLVLTALLGANALLGYMYVRARIMFVSGGLLALLAGAALDELWQRGERVWGRSGRTLVVITVALWVAVWGLALVRLRLQASASL